MHAISLMIMVSLALGAAVFFWSVYDFCRTLSMRSALVQSLAGDLEFVRDASYIWECDWRNQCDDWQFKKLRAIIRQHIDQLKFAHPAAVLSPLDQADLLFRYRYVRSLVREVEKRVQPQPQ
ncbi:hypothetical protein [Duganella radicis]|uniref:Uncharacterized protein n=1 Tax=Duganella radicis TaxID=551988 RepID=A0A6L6PRC3_9BURK|nr:hypothetical protein [Duganella radicis]MTV41364.1 hypothetical protein [Duganella radicis]